MIQSLGLINRPSPDTLESLKSLHFSYLHEATYAEPARSEQLEAFLLNVNEQWFAVMTNQDVNAILEHQTLESVEDLTQIAERLATEVICLSELMPLEPVFIPKPWGQEIWYSGIEARGVCTSNGVSIAWLTDALGNFIGCQQAPLLLKILDPFPTQNLGDLYFEMHNEKIEVYVVTNVDETAWPDGIGQIRYGFNQSLKAEYEDTDAFLADYVSAVKHYQEIRAEVDEQLAQAEGAEESGIRDDGQSTDQYLSKLANIDASLVTEENKRRDNMYRFTSLKPIRQGDVITVQQRVPHSLQHGVRVIEFQTPHYERYILSFGQKVLTQDHWDTDKALDLAVTEEVQFDKPTPLSDRIDLVADFNEFRVERIRIDPGMTFERTNERYSMLIGVSGSAEIRGQNRASNLAPEMAYFVPKGVAVALENAGESPALLLYAEELT